MHGATMKIFEVRKIKLLISFGILKSLLEHCR
jgi:hypothetical protein